MSDTTAPTGWTPAPGSLTRKGWPLLVRWAWWLGHRPLLVAVVGLGALVGVKAGPIVLAVLVAVIAVGLVAWWRVAPDSFHATVPIGRREDATPWTVRLWGSHTLVAGATGAGKGSVLWSLIRAIGPAVRDGLAEL